MTQSGAQNFLRAAFSFLVLYVFVDFLHPNVQLGDLVGAGLQLCGDLASDDQLFPANAGGAHALADAAFVSVGLCGVDQAIAQLDRRTNGFRCLSIVNKSGAQSQLGNLNAVCQRVSFIQNHCFSSSLQMSFAMRKTAHALGQPQ